MRFLIAPFQGFPSNFSSPSFFFVFCESTPLTALPHILSPVGELLELSITDMVPKGDWQQFERSLAQLLPLYSPSSGGVGNMETRRLVMGLQLMHLLVEARLADFHCCVETLLAEDATHPLIAYPLKLEAYLLEGRYNKVRRKLGLAYPMGKAVQIIPPQEKGGLSFHR